MKKNIAILGSTGSIGKSTLDVIQHNPQQYKVVALAAGNNVELIAKQALQFNPKLVSVATKDAAEQVRTQLPDSIQVLYGDEGLVEVATHPDCDYVVTAVVGSKGLHPTLSAIRAGKTIGLANKETLVTAGHLVMKEVRDRGIHLLPIDSEHSAIFQCLNGEKLDTVHKLILTSSGGSFRHLSRKQLKDVTVEQALQHPNWSMGAKITIDSATMMNKGFELIEAFWLFDIPYERIDVLIHPESIIHSMVEYQDCSVMAQLGTPDMRVPIQYALSFPDRIPSPSRRLNLAEIGQLHFRPMDFERFPLMRLAYECGQKGGTYPTVLNAANEIAVERFLQGDISFLTIESVIEDALEAHEPLRAPSLEEIIATDEWARDRARSSVSSL